MSNHYHLIISTPDPHTRIDRIIQLINSLVARAINRELGRTGHLWGERYKMKVLNSLEYLKKSVLYLYQNPVRANMVTRAVSYGRSTLALYLKKQAPHPPWFEPDEWTLSIGPYVRDLLTELLDVMIPRKDLFNMA